jgi:hypothetical protein
LWTAIAARGVAPDAQTYRGTPIAAAKRHLRDRRQRQEELVVQQRLGQRREHQARRDPRQGVVDDLAEAVAEPLPDPRAEDARGGRWRVGRSAGGLGRGATDHQGDEGRQEERRHDARQGDRGAEQGQRQQQRVEPELGGRDQERQRRRRRDAAAHEGAVERHDPARAHRQRQPEHHAAEGLPRAAPAAEPARVGGVEERSDEPGQDEPQQEGGRALEREPEQRPSGRRDVGERPGRADDRGEREHDREAGDRADGAPVRSGRGWLVGGVVAASLSPLRPGPERADRARPQTAGEQHAVRLHGGDPRDREAARRRGAVAGRARPQHNAEQGTGDQAFQGVLDGLGQRRGERLPGGEAPDGGQGQRA